MELLDFGQKSCLSQRTFNMMASLEDNLQYNGVYPFRCLSDPIWFDCHVVRNSHVPAGDLHWPVHPGRICHVLAETVSTGSR